MSESRATSTQLFVVDHTDDGRALLLEGLLPRRDHDLRADNESFLTKSLGSLYSADSFTRPRVARVERSIVVKQSCTDFLYVRCLDWIEGFYSSHPSL